MGIMENKNIVRWRAAAVLALALAVAPAAALELNYIDSNLWTRDRDCEAIGDTLLVALEYGLQVWDLGDTAQPMLLSDVYLDGQRARSVDTFGNLAAVTTQPGSLYLIDISDLGAPAVLSIIASELGTTPDVALVERDGTLFAYTAGKDTYGFRLYDLTDPAQPLLRGTLNASGLESLAPLGDTVFVVSLGGHLRSVDVSDPDNLVLLDLLDLIGSTFLNISAADSIAVVAAKDEGFFVIDIGDATDLVEIAHVHPTVNAVYDDLAVKEVILHDGLLHVVTDQAGPLVYDMADPANPVLIAYDSILDSGLPAPYGEFFDGDFSPERNRLYLCHWDIHMPGALIFDVAGPEPLYVGRSESNDFVRFPAMSGNMLYGCSGESGLYGLKLDAGQMVRCGNLPLAETWGAEAHGDLVYVASTDFGLVITDWIDPQIPTQRGSLDLGQARAVTVVDTVAYVAAFTQGFKTVDVSDANNPLLLGSALLPGIASVGLDVAPPLAATADLNIGVNFWDIADPADIVWLGNYDVLQKVVDVKIEGHLAYVATNGDSIHVLDIQDPALPVLLSKFGHPNPTGLEVNGLRLMVSAAAYGDSPGGVFAYALSDRVLPDPLFHYYTTGTAKGVASQGDLILVADDSALTLLSMGTTSVGETPLATGPRLDAWPNPFNPRTDLRFSLAANAVGSLDVFDIGGRHLRRLATGAFSAGQHQFDWDGKDDEGRALASGVYFARLAARTEQGAALEATRKLVLLR
jgi:hypothetical protein